MLRPIAITGFVAAAAVLLASAANFDLRVYPEVGESYNYKMAGTITIQGTDATIAMNVSETVSAKNELGWTVDVAQKDGLVNFEGQEIKLPSLTQSVTYRPDGVVQELKMAEGTNTDAYRLIQMATLFRPEQPQPEQIDFFYDFPADPARGIPTARATYKILGEELIGTIPTIKIDFRYAETTGDLPARNAGTYWLHKEKGVIVKAIQNWSDAPVDGAGAVSGKFTTDLIVAQ